MGSGISINCFGRKKRVKKKKLIKNKIDTLSHMKEMDSLIEECMVNQPVINIGMIGNVANGKSSLVKVLTGSETQRFVAEKKKNLTIRLGYSNCKIYKCPTCPKPQCFSSTPSDVFEHICDCGEKAALVTHISFVDCPGHAQLVSTMLNGTCVMDYTLLVESAEHEKLLSPQSQEHYNIVRIKKNLPVISCLNKIDIAKNIREKTNQLVNSLTALGSDIPVVPVSATAGINVDILTEYLASLRPPERNTNDSLKMIIIRSFDINAPGANIETLRGGVIGGSIVRGLVKLGDEIVIYPGYCMAREGVWSYCPIKGTVLSINSEKNSLNRAIPGGLVGIQVSIDPGLTRNDKLVGNVVRLTEDASTDANISVYDSVKIEFLEKINEPASSRIKVNVHATNVEGELADGDVRLSRPIAIDPDDTLSVSCSVSGKIIGSCRIISGNLVNQI